MFGEKVIEVRNVFFFCLDGGSCVGSLGLRSIRIWVRGLYLGRVRIVVSLNF